jgi:hypothetical protein
MGLAAGIIRHLFTRSFEFVIQLAMQYSAMY